MEKEFLNDLRDLMFNHGVKSIFNLECGFDKEGELQFIGNHAMIFDNHKTLIDYGTHADEILRQSMINIALDSGNEDLFIHAIDGDIYLLEEEV